MKLIDADALKEGFEKYSLWNARGVWARIDAAPTVRCGDCRKWQPYSVQEAFPPRCGTCDEGVADNDNAPFDAWGCAYFERRTP